MPEFDPHNYDLACFIWIRLGHAEKVSPPFIFRQAEPGQNGDGKDYVAIYYQPNAGTVPYLLIEASKGVYPQPGHAEPTAVFRKVDIIKPTGNAVGAVAEGTLRIKPDEYMRLIKMFNMLYPQGWGTEYSKVVSADQNIPERQKVKLALGSFINPRGSREQKDATTAFVWQTKDREFKIASLGSVEEVVPALVYCGIFGTSSGYYLDVAKRAQANTAQGRRIKNEFQRVMLEAYKTEYDPARMISLLAHDFNAPLYACFKDVLTPAVVKDLLAQTPPAGVFPVELELLAYFGKIAKWSDAQTAEALPPPGSVMRDAPRFLYRGQISGINEAAFTALLSKLTPQELATGLVNSVTEKTNIARPPYPTLKYLLDLPETAVSSQVLDEAVRLATERGIDFSDVQLDLTMLARGLKPETLALMVQRSHAKVDSAELIAKVHPALDFLVEDDPQKWLDRPDWSWVAGILRTRGYTNAIMTKLRGYLDTQERAEHLKHPAVDALWNSSFASHAPRYFPRKEFPGGHLPDEPPPIPAKPEAPPAPKAPRAPRRPKAGE